MKKIFSFLIFAVFLLLAGALPARAAGGGLDYGAFSRLPVQHEGRLKPMDSFARAWLTVFSGHATIDGLSATQWLCELLFDQERAYRRKAFNIPSPDVRNAIGLPQRAEHHYTVIEISRAFDAHKDMMKTLLEQDRKILVPAQAQLVDLYTNVLWYFEISRSLSFALPDFYIDNPALAKALGVRAKTPFTYMEFLPHRAAYLKLVKPLLAKITGRKTYRPAPDDLELLQIGTTMQHMEPDRGTKILRVIPPQWGKDRETWLSPWAVFQDGQGSPATAAQMKLWAGIALAYRNGDAAGWKENIKTISRDNAAFTDMPRLRAEYLMNRVQPFQISLGFYVLAFIAALAALGGRRPAYKASYALLGGGWAVHLIGMASRVYIMDRPPVATLYESILFVALIAVTGALLLEARTRHGAGRGMGLAVGAMIGTVLQFIGMRYASEGDSMGMLTAVLNTNFWLATHVVSVTIGYGACLVAGLLGHIWLAQYIFRPEQRDLRAATARSMTAVALVALFFATMGTILGGIWADQSWGRFWGWDPKENGALLVVLWLLWLLHGRLSGVLRPSTYAMGMALTVVVVAIAWFGVNLLNVGLHSYGFTTNIAFNLAGFIAFELSLVTAFAVAVWRRAGGAI